MCGASDQEKQISDAQQQMYQTLNDNYKTTFGQDQAITGALTSAFLPILQAGPSQTGYSPAEENALRTQNLEGVGTNYAQAQKATAQILAARSGGGSDSLLPSSSAAQVLAGNANAAALARSQGDLGITQANYDQGYKNWQAATNALTSTAGLINPLGYAGTATGAGSAAANSANQIAQQSNSIWNSAIGALGSIGGAALGNMGGLTNLFAKAPTPGSIGNTGFSSPAFSNLYSNINMAPPPISLNPGMTSPLPSF